MADTIFSDQDQSNCPICLDLLKDPVTASCGHTYCKVCINGFWDKQDQKKIYSCPQCRETFTPRPVLRRNNILAEVVEKVKMSDSSSRRYAGSGDVECDSCIGRKRKAANSCLVCLASYCEEHLKPHYQSQTFKKHSTWKNELKEEQIKSQQKIQKKQEKIQVLKQTVDIIKICSQAAVDDNEKIFTEMIRSMEKRRSEVTEMIRAQEKAHLSRAERLLKQLEQEIADLQRRVNDLEELSHTPDHIHFLQSFPSLCVSPGRDDSPSFTVHHHPFNGAKKFVSDLKKRVEEISLEEFNKICPQGAGLQRTLLSLKNREEYLQYFRYLTLDPNTANRLLILSENNRVMTWSDVEQRYPDHPDRFVSWVQVLCEERVCGRCYWEVEWSSKSWIYISVSYKEISRKGVSNDCVFGRNNQSWSLQCSSTSVSFSHNDVKTDLQGPASSRIGVYVDHGAGTLSFYNISKTTRLFHTVHTTFTQPLYAGFRIGSKSAVRLCDLERYQSV